MEFANCKFHYIPTIDVDIAYSYKNKGFDVGIRFTCKRFYLMLRLLNFSKDCLLCYD